jgi:hypothetical protein
LHQLARLLAHNFFADPDSASHNADDPLATASLDDVDLQPLIDRATAFLARAD